MKRSQESSPERPKQKRIKPSPPDIIGTLQNDSPDDGSEWTKVEKRKAKRSKSRKSNST